MALNNIILELSLEIIKTLYLGIVETLEETFKTKFTPLFNEMNERIGEGNTFLGYLTWPDLNISYSLQFLECVVKTMAK